MCLDHEDQFRGSLMTYRVNVIDWSSETVSVWNEKLCLSQQLFDSTSNPQLCSWSGSGEWSLRNRSRSYFKEPLEVCLPSDQDPQKPPCGLPLNTDPDLPVISGSSSWLSLVPRTMLVTRNKTRCLSISSPTLRTSHPVVAVELSLKMFVQAAAACVYEVDDEDELDYNDQTITWTVGRIISGRPLPGHGFLHISMFCFLSW